MDPTSTHLRSILDAALPVAREAGALLMKGWRGHVDVRSKSRSDLVTEYDLASEALIRERLGVLFPAHDIVGEEGGGSAGEWAWHVDPVDGTTNFAHGHPFFCLSMALAHHGEPVVGIVLAPAIGVEWSAVRGGGTTRNGTPCRVGTSPRLEDALLCTGFPAWRASRSDNNYRAFLALDSASRGARRCGAAAMEIALVADGAYDGFWDLGLKSWDVAAGMLLVREAGGTVSDFRGDPATLDGGQIILSNGLLHVALVSALAGDLPLPPLEGPLPGARGVR